MIAVSLKISWLWEASRTSTRYFFVKEGVSTLMVTAERERLQEPPAEEREPSQAIRLRDRLNSTPTTLTLWWDMTCTSFRFRVFRSLEMEDISPTLWCDTTCRGNNGDSQERPSCSYDNSFRRFPWRAMLPVRCWTPPGCWGCPPGTGCGRCPGRTTPGRTCSLWQDTKRGSQASHVGDGPLHPGTQTAETTESKREKVR